MGLDMYLNKRHYVGNEYREPTQQIRIKYPKQEDGKKVMFPLKKGAINESKIVEVTERAAYWRKVNAVHEWFVENVQSGEDDCKEYYVDHEQIERLVDLCKQVLEGVKTNKPLPKDTSDWQQWEDIKVLDDTTAKDLLPVADGFFFGSQRYDGDYLYGIMQTVEQLEPLTKKREDGYYEDDGELYYRASW